MATVYKCDNCGAFDSMENHLKKIPAFPIETNEYLFTKDRHIEIKIRIPWDKREDGHLCDICWRAIVSSRFADLCGLIAPYQPTRTAGLVQGTAAVKAMPEITEGDLQLLRRLRNLLPAGE